MVSLEFASYRRVIARSPATPVIPGIYAKNVVIWVIGGRTWGKPGRFVLQKWLFSLEFNSSFSYVGRLPPEDSVVKVRTIRFVGLPFIFASRGGWRTDAWRQFPKDSRQQFSGSCDRSGPTGNVQNTMLRVIWRLL